MQMNSMSQDISVETEQGEFVDSPNVSIRDFQRAVYKWMPEEKLKQTHCLQFIDDYGDTTFNSLQQPILLEELKDMVTSSNEPEAREFFGPIIEFLSKYQDEIRFYVKFYGD
ncbi:MAG: hypothetical protein ABI791_15930 [Acidobacteriota bacterium]